MLWSRWIDVLELLECLSNVSWNREVDLACDIVPIHCDVYVLSAIPVSSNCVAFFQCKLELQDIFVPYVFYSKIVNDKCELN